MHPEDRTSRDLIKHIAQGYVDLSHELARAKACKGKQGRRGEFNGWTGRALLRRKMTTWASHKLYASHGKEHYLKRGEFLCLAGKASRLEGGNGMW